MKGALTIFYSLMLLVAFGQNKANFILDEEPIRESLVSSDVTVLLQITGDLDGDDVREKVIVLESVDTQDQGKTRTLLINKRVKNQWEQWASIAGGLMPSESGEHFIDPLERIFIEENRILVKHFGGTERTWNYTHYYGFLEGTWQLTRVRILENDPCQEKLYIQYDPPKGQIAIRRILAKCDAVGNISQTAEEQYEQTIAARNIHMQGFVPRKQFVDLPELHRRVAY